MRGGFGIGLVGDAVPRHQFMDEIKRAGWFGIKPARTAPRGQRVDGGCGDSRLKRQRRMHLPFELVPCFSCDHAYDKLPNTVRQSAFKAESFAGLPNTLHENRGPQQRNKWAQDRLSRTTKERVSCCALGVVHDALFKDR